ncbi:hypothetical protein AB0K09_04940 [Streptomyces sp. NPDC049577]|uniref:hypothetical protein n=1 Tax=Streptomyces sp. NPDC049577 TaxID=3155153 RepID=UPI0034316E72
MNASSRPPVSRRGPLVVAAAYALAGAAFLTVFIARRDRLPDPVATHFSGSGGADGFTSLGSFPYESLGLLLIPAALFAWLARLLPGARPLIALGWGVAGLLGAALVAVVLGNARAASADGARLGLGELAAALAVAAALGGLGFLLAGRPPAHPAGNPEPAPVPRLELRPGESAAWTRTLGSRPLLVTGAAHLVLGVVLAPLVDWGLGVGLTVVALLTCAFSGTRVMVDQHGLTVGLLGLPRPRLRIPLARITSATSRHIDPLRDLGGWGYRVVPGRSGLALRSGEALIARLANGSEFVVTVDDATTAAALLNALIERARPDDGG